MKHILKIMRGMVLLTLLVSCSNSLAMGKPDPGEMPVPEGYGRALINLSLEGGGEIQTKPAFRTIFPNDFTAYELTFAYTGPNTAGSMSHDPAPWTDGQNTVDLEIGNWDITVNAYTGAAAARLLSGRGSGSVEVKNGTITPVNIPITMKWTGQETTSKGTLAYSFGFPAGTYTTKALTLYRGDGATHSEIPLTGINLAEGPVDLAPDAYYLTVGLKNDQDRSARWTTSFHIYNGQTTRVSHTFTAADFSARVPMWGNVDIDSALTLKAAVEAFSGPDCTPLQLVESSAVENNEYVLYIPSSYTGNLYLRLKAVTDSEIIYCPDIQHVTFTAVTAQKDFSAAVYSIAIPGISNGTITASPAAFAHSTVSVTAKPDTGYLLKSLDYSNTDGTNPVPIVSGVFEMPEKNIRLNAVFIDGSTVVASMNGTIYASLDTAFTAATGSAAVPAVITLLKDMELSQSISLAGGQYIQLVSADAPGYTIKWPSASLTSSLITLAAGSGLTLGNGVIPVTLDGGSVARTQPLVLVNGILTLKAASVVQNNNNTSGSSFGGGVRVETGGKLTMEGGSVRNNQNVNGGGIYNAGGTVTMSADASLTGNSALDGGGIYLNGGSVAMEGSARITGNSATASGAGVYLKTGTLTLSGGVQADANNQVYLSSDAGITVGGTLTAPVAAVIRPASFAAGRVVLKGEAALIAANNAHFEVAKVLGAELAWKVDASGKLINNLQHSRQWHGAITYHESLSAAMNDEFPSGSSLANPVVITLNDDVAIDTVDTYMTIPDGHFIQLVTSGSPSITRISAVVTNKPVFKVPSGSGLILGDDLNALEINGGSGSSINNGYPLMEVSGTLIMKNAQLGDNNNTATIGGALYIRNGGTFIMNGGSIDGNTTTSSGGAVYIDDGGTFIMNDGSIEYNTANISGGGVYISGANAAFTMNGGSITGNTAASTISGDGGGAVYISSGGNFTMDGGEIISTGTDNSAVYVNGTFTISGSAHLYRDALVYLPTGKTITLGGDLTETFAAGIAPETGYAVGPQVLSGAFLSANHRKFLIFDTAAALWWVDASGKVTKSAEPSVTCIIDPGYSRLSFSITNLAVNKNSPVTVTVTNPDTLTIGSLTVRAVDYQGKRTSLNVTGTSFTTPTDTGEYDIIVTAKISGKTYSGSFRLSVRS